jgi:predicted amidophosphoribosyltransferase
MRAHEESLARAQEAARAAAREDAEARAANERMLCPTCTREYPRTTVHCPQDATKLVPLQRGMSSSGPPTGCICPACRRGFAAGTKLCPNDGEELIPYTMHAAMAAKSAPNDPGSSSAPPRGKICPTCGGRFDGNATFCGKDGTALVLLN